MKTAPTSTRDEFATAFRDIVTWLHHPHAWWGWIVAGPLWPFTAHIMLYYQIKDAAASRQQSGGYR